MSHSAPSPALPHHTPWTIIRTLLFAVVLWPFAFGASGCAIHLGNPQFETVGGSPTELSPGVARMTNSDSPNPLEHYSFGTVIDLPIIPYLVLPIRIHGMEFTPKGPTVVDVSSSLLQTRAVASSYRKAHAPHPRSPLPKVAEVRTNEVFEGALFYSRTHRQRTAASLDDFDAFWDAHLSHDAGDAGEPAPRGTNVPEYETLEQLRLWGVGLLWYHSSESSSITGKRRGISGPLWGCIGWKWTDEGGGPCLLWMQLW